MKDLAPDICRQRLLVEGFYSAELDEKSVASFMKDLAAHLDLRAYGEVLVHSAE